MLSAFIKPLQIVGLAAVVALSGARVVSAEDAGSHYQTAAGVSAYIGVVPAEIVKGHPLGHSERTMHDGPPARSSEYHLIVAIFDATSGARITDAKVSVTVFGPGNTMLYGQQHMKPWGSRPSAPSLPRASLEPMSISGTITYGGFFQLTSALYTIQVAVLRPGKQRPAILNFTYDNRS